MKEAANQRLQALLCKNRFQHFYAVLSCFQRSTRQKLDTARLFLSERLLIRNQQVGGSIPLAGSI
jgi:hypothetical protein